MENIVCTYSDIIPDKTISPVTCWKIVMRYKCYKLYGLHEFGSK